MNCSETTIENTLADPRKSRFQCPKDGEVSATKFVKSGHMNAQADITPIEFGGLDEALSAIHGIRGNAHEQKGRLKQVK